MAAFFFPIILFLSGAPGLMAQEKDEAKEHFLKGKALVEEGAYEKAVVELKASFDLKKVPIVIYNIAICYDEMHQYADAIRYYKMYLEMKEGQDTYLAENIEKRIEVLGQFIGYLDVQVDQAGAEALLDGKLVGTTPLEKIFIESGNHELVIRKTGFYEIKEQVTVVSDKVEERSYTMEKIVAEGAVAAHGPGGAGEGKAGGKETASGEGEGGGRPSKKKLPAAPFWSMLGVTLLFTAGVAVTGGLAIRDNSALGEMSRSEDWKPVADRRDKLALSADILWGAVAASAVTTLVLAFFTDFRKEKRTSVSLAPSPGRGLIMGFERKF
jgi:hypothetical protein